MKNVLGSIVVTIVVSFFLILSIFLINSFVIVEKANSYHQTCIAELQSSNFAPDVIRQYQGDTGDFHTTITNRSNVIDSVDNLDKTGRIYEVTTTYTLKIPIIGYSSTKTIHGFAR